MAEIQCPRCGATAIREIKTSGPTKEFECLGKCGEGIYGWDGVYFQYETDTHIYCWPARVMYNCHEDDLDAVRAGKIEAEII